jgi:hypothetical protein
MRRSQAIGASQLVALLAAFGPPLAAVYLAQGWLFAKPMPPVKLIQNIAMSCDQPPTVGS